MHPEASFDQEKSGVEKGTSNNFLSRARSAVTIICDSPWVVVTGFHPRMFLALEGSPTRRSTSAGRRSAGSTITMVRPLEAQRPTSESPKLTHSRFIPAASNDCVVKSRTLVVVPVARTNVPGSFSLKHPPHSLNKLTSKSPVTLRIQIAKLHRRLLPKLYPRHSLADLSRNEFCDLVVAIRD